MKSLFLATIGSLFLWLSLWFFFTSSLPQNNSNVVQGEVRSKSAAAHLLEKRNFRDAGNMESLPKVSAESIRSAAASSQAFPASTATKPSRPVGETNSHPEKNLRNRPGEHQSIHSESLPTYKIEAPQQTILAPPGLASETRFIEVPAGESIPLVLSEVLADDDFTPQEIAKNAALADEFLKSAIQSKAVSQPAKWRGLVNQADELFRTWYGTEAFLAMESRRQQELSKDQTEANQ